MTPTTPPRNGACSPRWMYCAETASEATEGWEYFHNQLLAAQHH